MPSQGAAAPSGQASAGHHEGRGIRPAQEAVGHADDDRLRHGRVLLEHMLDLGGKTLKTDTSTRSSWRSTIVSEPSSSMTPTSPVWQPAGAIEGGPRGEDVLEVAGQDVGAADENLARIAVLDHPAVGVDDLHLDAGEGTPTASGAGCP